ncbi:MAG: putative Ig domain-containing protein [Tepidisphaeraceae bacterium]
MANSLSVTTVALTGGAITGTGSLMSSGLFTWSAGTLSVPSVTVNEGLSITGDGVILSGSTLMIPSGQSATMSGSADVLELINGTLDNAGTFTASGDEIINNGGTDAFNNSGAFDVTGTFTVNNGVPLNNTGTVEVKGGTLTLNGGSTGTGATYLVDSGATLVVDNGTYTFDAATSIRGAGTVTFSGGTNTVNGTYDITGSTIFTGGATTFSSGSTVTSLGNGSLLVSGGSVTFDSSIAGLVSGPLVVTGTLNLVANSLSVTTVALTGGAITGTGSLSSSGLFTWSAGTLSVPSVTVNGGLSITGDGLILSGSTLMIPSGQSATMSGGADVLELINGVIDNVGTFTASGEEIIDNGGTDAFNNSGSFDVTGSFTVNNGVPLKNSGTLNLQSSLADNGGFTQTATGTTYVFIGGTSAGQFTQLIISGGGSATLAGTLGVTLTNSFTPSVGSSFKVLTVTSSITGQFSKYNGVVNGSTYLSPVYQSADLLLTAVPTSAPSISSAATATFTTGSAGTFTVTSTAAPSAGLTETGPLPGGVTFVDNGNGTATLSGTPVAGSGATYPLTISASNGVSPGATQFFTLTVDQAPAITSASSSSFTTASSGAFTVTTTGFPTAAVTESGALPSGVAFVDNHNGTATLSGTPAAGTGASYVLTLTANNAVTPNATQMFTLTVDQAPSITSAPAKAFTTGAAGTFSITTSAFPIPTLVENGALPSGVTFVDNGNGTATLSGTPAAGAGGTYGVAITAANGISPSAVQALILTVDQAPAITSAPSTGFIAGAVGAFTVATTAYPTAALSEVGALPGGVTFVDNGNGTATISGMPAAGTGATYDFAITAANGVSPSANQTFTLTVGQPAAITSASFATFITGASSSFAVDTTGFPTASLTETGTLPGGVEFLDNGNGTATLSGTPAATAGGSYLLTITGANGVGGVASQTFTLTVDEAPAITSSSSATFITGDDSSFAIATAGFPAAALTETGTLPTGVSFLDNGDGTATLAGISAATAGGTYSLTITAANGIGANATQTFTLTVDEAPAIAHVSNPVFTAGSQGSITVTSTGFPNAALSETGSLPSGVTFVDNGNGTATLSGTPAATAGGTYVLTLTAANSVLPSATQTVTLSVDQAPAITSASSASFSLDEPGTFTVTTTALPNAALTESGDLPGGLTFRDNGDGTATISGTPTQVGTFPLTLTAANGISPNADQSFTLTVIQPPGDSAPTITSAASIIFAAGLPSSFTVSAAGVPDPSLMETGALPDGITFTDNGDGTASLAGTASLTAGATFPLSISASNNVGSPFVQSFTLTIEVPTITQTNGVITGDGTDVDDVASVSYSNGNVVVTIDGLTDSFAMSSVTGININLGAGDDSITLGAGVPAVNFNGAAGNDSVVANNSAADTLAGGSGNDTIIGGGKGSSLTGNGGDDMVAPESHHETVNGGGGNDTVSGAGHDSMRGGGGDDIFLDGGMKKDSINGGAGLNFAQFNPTDTMSNIYETIDPPAPVTPSVSGAAVSSAPGKLSADALVGGPADASDAVTASIVNGELKVTGTSGPDVISVTLNGAGTKLKVTGNGSSAGSFKLSALTGIHINGGPGADSITIGSSITLPATLLGNGGADTLIGGGGDNVEIGGPGGDSLVGGAGTNLLVPDQNASFVTGPAGNDTLDGGTGFSIADFSRRTDALTLSNNGVADSGDTTQGEGDDIMANVSAIWGGSGGNTITGATGGEFLSGGAGANSVHGGGANDLLVGGGGNDTVIVAAEPVSLYLINGQPNKYGGVSNPSEDILQLDSLDSPLT